jgi:hypothetical protein
MGQRKTFKQRLTPLTPSFITENNKNLKTVQMKLEQNDKKRNIVLTKDERFFINNIDNKRHI